MENLHEIRKFVRKTLLNEADKNYITHFNGGRPFSIHKSDNHLYIFKHAL